MGKRELANLAGTEDWDSANGATPMKSSPRARRSPARHIASPAKARASPAKSAKGKKPAPPNFLLEMLKTIAGPGCAVLAIIVAMAGDAKQHAVLGDLVAACLAALVVAPLAMIIDVAVTKAASGKQSVLSGLVAGASSTLANPLALVSQPAFQLSLFVYVCTYGSANITEVVCTQYLKVPFALPKLVAATAGNMASCVYKDARIAQMEGKASSKPFPTSGYLLFLARDVLANAGGFTFPPIVALMLGVSAATAQLLVPAAINLVSSPLHLLGLSLYNNPKHSLGKHLGGIAKIYASVTSTRILKGLCAYGLGGVSNNYLKVKIGSLA